MEFYTVDATTPANLNGRYGIYLYNSFASGNKLMFVYSTSTDSYAYHDSFLTIGSTANVIVRASFDGTGNLAFDYSTDGTNFLTGTTYNLRGAQQGLTLPWNNAMAIDLLGFSNGGGAIGATTMLYDNFSVSAVPEPSTYAALAGACALGLAIWKRKHKAPAL